MNSPVTHAECMKHMEELEDKFHVCIKDEQIDFKEALAGIKEWVGKLEGKMDNLVLGLLVLALEGFIGLVMLVFTMLGGRP